LPNEPCQACMTAGRGAFMHWRADCPH
jgi:hypothetical protein